MATSLKVHRLVVLAALLLVGVMAFGATLVVRHRRGLVRRAADVPEAPDPPVRQAPRPLAATPAPWHAPLPAPVPPTDSLRVRVVGPHGLLPAVAEVTALRRRCEGSQGECDHDELIDLAEDDDGTFTADELEPGTYDIQVKANGLRRARLQGVRSGGDVVDVELDRAPILLGALGNGTGGGCEGLSVHASAPDGDAEAEDPSDDEEIVDAGGTVDAEGCTFMIEPLPERGPLTVSAGTGERTDRGLVTLPVQGDPAFLCLRPPCDVQPAALAVYVADGAGRVVESAALQWTLVGDETHGEMGTLTGGGGLSYLHRRRAGQTLRIRATVEDRAAEVTAVVGPGVTDVVLMVP